MIYNIPKGKLRSVQVDYKNDFEYLIDKKGNTFVKVYYMKNGRLCNLPYKNYYVNKFLIPLNVFNKCLSFNFHLNSFGKKFLYSVSKYNLDKNGDLVLKELIDIKRNTLGNVKQVHKHCERVNKKGYIIHSKKHIIDKECKNIKSKLRK